MIQVQKLRRAKEFEEANGVSYPAYKTKGAAAFDLRALGVEPFGGCTRQELIDGDTILFKTGLCFAVARPLALLVLPRSGIALRSGLTLVNDVGLIDPDFRGEVMVALRNDSRRAQTVEWGERIAQAMVTHAPQAQLEVVDQLDTTERGDGGFGSTGRD